MDSGTPPLMSLAGQVVLLTLNVTLDVQRFVRTNIWSDFLIRCLLNRCSTTCSIHSLELCNTQSGKGLSSIVTPLVVFPTWPTRRWCPCPTFGLERFLLCFFFRWPLTLGTSSSLFSPSLLFHFSEGFTSTFLTGWPKFVTKQNCQLLPQPAPLSKTCQHMTTPWDIFNWDLI